MELIRHIVYNQGFLLFCLFLAGLLIVLGLKSRRSMWKHVFYNISALFITLFIFEIYSSLTWKESDIGKNAIFSGSFVENSLVSGPKEYVGYGPVEDSSFEVSSIRKNGNSLIYDVSHTFCNGKRLVPNNNESSHQYIALLGGSYAFGDGLNDNQTLPYFINKYSNSKFNIHNHAFNGYGTHQALKIIEEKIIHSENLIVSDSNVVIYWYIPQHIGRAAGHSIWDPYGPCYEIENDCLVYKGSFDKNRWFKQNSITKRVKAIWRNSFLYRSFFEHKINCKDVLRVNKIMDRMNELLAEKGIRFIVFVGFSKRKYPYQKAIHQYLFDNNIEHYFATSIIEDIKDKSEEYLIIGDGHPNEKYNRAIGAFFAKEI